MERLKPLTKLFMDEDVVLKSKEAIAHKPYDSDDDEGGEDTCCHRCRVNARRCTCRVFKGISLVLTSVVLLLVGLLMGKAAVEETADYLTRDEHALVRAAVKGVVFLFCMLCVALLTIFCSKRVVPSTYLSGGATIADIVEHGGVDGPTATNTNTPVLSAGDATAAIMVASGRSSYKKHDETPRKKTRSASKKSSLSKQRAPLPFGVYDGMQGVVVDRVPAWGSTSSQGSVPVTVHTRRRL